MSLSSDTYSKSEADAKLVLKAPLANPAFTGTVTVQNALFVDGGNVIASIDAKQGTLTSPLPSVTGGLQVLAGAVIKNLKAGTGMTLSSDANAITIAGPSNFYTTTAIDDKLALKAPLASPTFTITTTCASVRATNNIYTDNPDGFTLSGDVNSLGVSP